VKKILVIQSPRITDGVEMSPLTIENHKGFLE
jgi:hypothetical protein